jgi:hypothetical protein
MRHSRYCNFVFISSYFRRLWLALIGHRHFLLCLPRIGHLTLRNAWNRGIVFRQSTIWHGHAVICGIRWLKSSSINRNTIEFPSSLRRREYLEHWSHCFLLKEDPLLSGWSGVEFRIVCVNLPDSENLPFIKTTMDVRILSRNGWKKGLQNLRFLHIASIFRVEK